MNYFGSMTVASFIVLYSACFVTATLAAALSKYHYSPEANMNVVSSVNYAKSFQFLSKGSVK